MWLSSTGLSLTLKNELYDSNIAGVKINNFFSSRNNSSRTSHRPQFIFVKYIFHFWLLKLFVRKWKEGRSTSSKQLLSCSNACILLTDRQKMHLLYFCVFVFFVCLENILLCRIHNNSQRIDFPQKQQTGYSFLLSCVFFCCSQNQTIFLDIVV
jgi:hypothetical protein